jgi:hypothetical protein
MFDLDSRTRTEVEELLVGLTAGEQALAGRLAGEITARIGTFPVGPVAADAPNPVWVAAYLAAGPPVADWMIRRGIPDAVIASTLSDVGRHLRLHRRHTGTIGLDAPHWPSVVLTGSMYELGRLQFDLKLQQGSWVLDVHIPESGPLTPAAVEASFDTAMTFFARYFPDQPVTTAVCESWLLDPYLAEHLPATSNVVAFAQRFTPVGVPRDDELDAVYFTFGQRSLDNLDRLPRDSSLQRLVLDRLAAGGQWTVVSGSRLIGQRTPTEP